MSDDELKQLIRTIIREELESIRGSLTELQSNNAGVSKLHRQTALHETHRIFAKSPVLNEVKAFNADKLWQTVLMEIQSFIRHAPTFETWFKETHVDRYDPDHLTLYNAANNAFSCSWLRDKYSGLVVDLLATVSGQQLQVEFVVAANGRSDQYIGA